MRTELDLLQDYCELNDAKIDSWGRLPATLERRWRGLKAFYDDLLTRRAFECVPPGERFSVAEVAGRLPHRSRLRVPADMDVFFCFKDSYVPSRAVDVSHGGLFLGSPVHLPEKSLVTVYMPNLGRAYETLFETDVEVVWSTKGDGEHKPRGVGARFADLEESTLDQLDTFLLSYLQKRLSRTMAGVRPAWLREGSVVV